MDRKKLLEFFDAKTIKENIHIVGCGAIGSHVAEQLARIGCEKIHLWDFDKVEPHNITNQMFFEDDIDKPKVEAVAEMMIKINKELKDTLVLHNEALKAPWLLDGYIFMCVDNIDVRREIVKANKFNPNAIFVCDFRMALTEAQYYSARFVNKSEVDELLNTMNYTNEEAQQAVPLSACGVELSVIYTVKTIVSCGIKNFCSLIQELPTYTKIFAYMNGEIQIESY